MTAEHPPSESGLNLSISVAIVLVILLALLGQRLGPLLANGTISAVVKDQQVGPYNIQVGIQPAPARVGNLHVGVLVKEFEAGETIIDANVLVSAKGPSGSTSAGPVQAQHALRNLESYEANLPLDLAGSWTLSVDVTSHLGRETIEVPLAVSEPGGFSLAFVVALGVATTMALIWTWGLVRRMSRRHARAPKTRKR